MTRATADVRKNGPPWRTAPKIRNCQLNNTSARRSEGACSPYSQDPITPLLTVFLPQYFPTSFALGCSSSQRISALARRGAKNTRMYDLASFSQFSTQERL